MRAALVFFFALTAACDCARPLEGGIYACEADGTCPDGERCMSGLCLPADAGAGGGGAAGGGTAGGAAGGSGGGGGGGTAGGDAGLDAGCGFNPDPLDDQGIDSNCDGVDGVAAESVFVDPISGTDNGGGTMGSPARTLSQGVSIVLATPPKLRVIVAEGYLVEPVTIVTGRASIYGGFSRTDGGWPRDRLGGGCGDGGRPLIFGAPVAMKTEPGDASVTLDSFCIVAADGDGGASIALAVVNAKSNVTMRELDLTAGNGSDGVKGEDGDAGLEGGFGQGGLDAIVDGSNNQGGAGGVSPCGVSGTAGGTSPNAGSSSTGGSGTNVASALGGARGGAGGSSIRIDECGLSCSCGTQSGPGGAGGDGGVAGTAGLPGRPGVRDGQVDATALWQPVNGTAGDAGANGQPGAGGGAGGSYRLKNGLQVNGPSGGGGAAGGCGGLGGKGGGSGGASISLLLLNSRPSFVGRIQLTPKRGGNGAPGGIGGLGGEGGEGGDGGLGISAWCSGSGSVTFDGGTLLLTGPLATLGGRGGNGTPGGRGGIGGGGAGGPSMAVWCTGDAGYAFAPGQQAFVTLNTGAAGTGAAGALDGLAGMAHPACKPP